MQFILIFNHNQTITKIQKKTSPLFPKPILPSATPGVVVRVCPSTPLAKREDLIDLAARGTANGPFKGNLPTIWPSCNGSLACTGARYFRVRMDGPVIWWWLICGLVSVDIESVRVNVNSIGMLENGDIF